MKLTIEKMIYGGDGLARSPEGKAAFVPLVLPGEEVSATVTEEKPGFIRATLAELLSPSEKRITAACPYFSSCGGCHYQHTDYQTQVEFKRDILRETLRRTAKFEWTGDITVHSGGPWGYRNRTRLKVRTRPEFALGYHRRASHDLLPVETCAISSPAINRTITCLWELGRSGSMPEGVNEIEIFANHDDSALLLELYGISGSEKLQPVIDALQSGVPETSGVAFFAAAPDHGAGPTAVFGQEGLTYKAGGASFRVSAGSFFQTNRYLIDELAGAAVANASGNVALDLYAGAGLFARHLADRFHRVTAVESSPASARDLKANVPKNVTAVRATTEEFLAKFRGPKPDLAVVDPPRAGLGDKVTKLLASMAAAKVVYLSCDPTTMARDLSLFLKSGYRVEEVHLFDLFPQTFHVESLVRLGR